MHSNKGGCNANGTVECTAQVGGLFDEDASTTWAFSNLSSLSTAPEDPTINPPHHMDSWGRDTLAVTPQEPLIDFAMGVSRGQGESMNTLGLGRNSTLLDGLVGEGIISSKTWGYWQGWQGAKSQHQYDGNLILGGYDAAKTTGPNTTFATADRDGIEANCYRVRIKDITMNFKNGSSSGILDSSKSTEKIACILPNFDVLSLSKAMWSSFLDVSGSTYVGRSTSVLAWYGMLVEANGAYDGDLTISLDQGLNNQGLDITIPNHQLVVPNTKVDSNGQTYVCDDGYREVLINSLEGVNADDRLVLGAPFLTSAYMMVDNHRKQFTLWKSKPTTTSSIVAVPAPNCENSEVSTSPSPTPAALRSPRLHTSISSGVIAGAVLGALTGAGLLALVFFFFMKKRRHRAQDQRAAKNSDNSARPLSQMLYKPELSSDRQPPQEIPSVRDPEYAIAPYEMSEGKSYRELPAEGPKNIQNEMPGVTPLQEN